MYSGLFSYLYCYIYMWHSTITSSTCPNEPSSFFFMEWRTSEGSGKFWFAGHTCFGAQLMIVSVFKVFRFGIVSPAHHERRSPQQIRPITTSLVLLVFWGRERMRRTRPRRWMRLVYFVADPIKGSCHIYGARIFFSDELELRKFKSFCVCSLSVCCYLVYVFQIL